MRRHLIPLLAMLVAVACTSSDPVPEIQPPATTTPTTTLPSVVVRPASDPPPRGVNLRSSCMHRATFGDPAASLYRLPFNVGETYSLNQSYCFGQGGHSTQLAYDFLLPIGTPVNASRAGKVILFHESSPDEGGGEANFIYIQHDDGTVALYAHLQENGVAVELGQEVVAGERIASAGSSGLGRVPLPHLHFAVYGSWPTSDGGDIGVNFSNADGPLDLLGGLIMGSVYTALPPDSPVPSRQITPLGHYPDADLRGVELDGANLWGYDFAGADLSGARLSGATLGWALLPGADLTDVDLSGADLTGADLTGATLTGANLANTDLTLADLTNATLVGADLTTAYLASTNLTGADLTGAELVDATLIGIRFNESTRWPDGFQPPAQP